MLELLCKVLSLVTWVLIGWIVLSYVVMFGRLGWDHPVRRLYDGLTKVIEPVLQPIRRAIPPLPVGGASIDLSPLILIVGINLLIWYFCR